MFFVRVFASKTGAWEAVQRLNIPRFQGTVEALSAFRTPKGDWLVGVGVSDHAPTRMKVDVQIIIRQGLYRTMTAEEFAAAALQAPWALLGDAGSRPWVTPWQ